MIFKEIDVKQLVDNFTDKYIKLVAKKNEN